MISRLFFSSTTSMDIHRRLCFEKFSFCRFSFLQSSQEPQEPQLKDGELGIEGSVEGLQYVVVSIFLFLVLGEIFSCIVRVI